jgi:hypothetical protein
MHTTAPKHEGRAIRMRTTTSWTSRTSNDRMDCSLQILPNKNKLRKTKNWSASAPDTYKHTFGDDATKMFTTKKNYYPGCERVHVLKTWAFGAVS